MAWLFRPLRVLVLVGIGCAVLVGTLPAQEKVAEPAKKPAPKAEEAQEPARRLEEIERIRKEFAPTDATRQYGPDDRISLSGVVVTADGAALPAQTSLGGSTRRVNYNGSFSASLNEMGEFSATVEFGRIFMYVMAPGYAPTLVGPLAADPGGKIENVRLTLSRGFTARIRLLDEQAKPIAGAKINSMYLHGEDGSGIHVAERETITNEEGVAVLEQCTDYPLTAETEPPGFQLDRTILKLRPDGVTDWTLKKAQPTTGTVFSRLTGEPLSGAEVRLVQRDGFNPRIYTPQDGSGKPPLLAKTDEKGQFTLNTLRDDCEYSLYVTAPEHGGELVFRVRSGKSGIKVELGPPRVVRGKVVGDLSRLERRRINGAESPYFQCINPLKLGRMLYHYPILVPVKIQDGEGHFEIHNLFPGQVRLEFPGHTQTLELATTLDDVTVQLAAAPATPTPQAIPKRKVVLKLKTPAGEPPVRGALLVRMFPIRPPATYETKTLAISNNQVEFEAAMPCRLQWETDHLTGYWIKEEQIELAEAPTPLVKEIEAVPAGAIYGRVLERDGSPCHAFSYSTLTVSPAPAVQQTYLGVNLASGVQDREGRFMIGPLPLGGTYRVEVQGQGERSNTRATSEELTLTREDSVRNIEIRMPEGVTIAGQVVDPDGQPVPGIEVRLGHRTANRSHEGVSQRTDGEGKFRFPYVNTELPGSYYMHVQPQQTYRGQQALWKAGAESLVIQLQRGAVIAGVLLEHKSGKVIPGATLYAQPAAYDQQFYLGRHEVRTDAAGRFRFETLEPVPYRFFANGINAAQGAPPWEADPRSGSEITLSGDVQKGADVAPVPPPPEEP